MAEPLRPQLQDDTATVGAVQLHALKLFDLFSAFEARAFPGGNKMTLGDWGSRFQQLIDESAPAADGWTYVTHGRRTLYTYQVTNVIPLTVAPAA